MGIILKSQQTIDSFIKYSASNTERDNFRNAIKLKNKSFQKLFVRSFWFCTLGKWRRISSGFPISCRSFQGQKNGLKNYLKITLFLFVCFKGGIGTCPGFPLCLMNVSIFAEYPQSREFPLHHYSGLGTRTVRQTFGSILICKL